MASIPLPALAAKPPEVSDPAQSYQRLLALKSMMGQQQLQQSEIQNQALARQQQEIALQQQQAGMKAMQQWDGKNYDELPDLIAKNGGSLQTVMAAKKNIVDFQTALATKTKDELANEKEVNDRAAGLLDSVAALPPEQQAQGFENAKQQIGALYARVNDPRAQQIAGMQYQGPQQLETLKKGTLGYSAAIESALKQAQTGAAEQSARKSQIEADALQASGGMTPQQREARYQNIIAKPANQRTPEETQFAQGYEAANTKRDTSVDSMTGAVRTSTTGPAGLAGSNGRIFPRGAGAASPQSSLVDEIGTGKMALQRLDYMITRNPQLAQAVAIKYPDFDAAKIRSYIDTTKDFTSGKSSVVLNAGGTALKHLQELKSIVDESPVFARTPGTNAYQRYENKLQTVATELARFYAGGTAPSIPEINEIKKTMGATIGSRDAAILEQAKSMGDKLDSMEQTWANAAPSKAYQAPMPGIDAKAKAARAALDPDYKQRVGGEQVNSGGFDWAKYPKVN